MNDRNMVALVLPFNIEFLHSKKINPNLNCVYCKKLLRKPKQTNCGHRFCENCLEQLIKDPSGAAVCPVDNEELNSQEIFPDRCCEKDIEKLECYCTNRKLGCEWQGQLLNLKEHVIKCKYSLVECPNPGCKEQIENRHLADHVQNMCNFRLITCENCGEQAIHSDKEQHHKQCPKVEIQCTTGCGAIVPRGDLDEHVTKHCVNAPIACPFEQTGCDFKGLRGDVKEHESKAIAKHIQMLGDKNKECSENQKKMEEKISKLESEKEQLETQIKESREALAYTKQDLQTQQTKLGITEKKIAKQKEELNQLKKVLDSIQHDDAGTEKMLESQMAEIISLVESQDKRLKDLEGNLTQGPEKGYSFAAVTSLSIERRLERNEHVSALSEAQIEQHDIRLQMLEATSYDGTYIWKIDEWSKRVRDARIGKTSSIYSPPFYVGRYGYKVCGRLYPCGDGIGKDSHVSLFFVVMKGEYDALLEWPFRQKVTFKLLDPNRVRDITDCFRPDPNSSSFQRPRSAMNIASGTPQFVSQKQLNNGGYVVDDTLYIKITVDRTGLREL